MKSYSGIGRYLRELINAKISVKEFSPEIKPYSLSEQTKLPKLVDSQQAELIHYSHINQPLGKTETPRITTIHDLTMLDYPLAHSMSFKKRIKQTALKLSFKRMLSLNSHFLTPSQFVADQLTERFNIDKSKISVTHLGASSLSAEATKPKQLIPADYYLYVGNALPHKNLELLVELCRQNKKLNIILAGKRDSEFDTMLKNPPINCIQQDSPSDAELVWLYKNARALIFPSLSEGFGLPGLEAMQNGCPVISSNSTCLPEIYGDAALYFDPRSVDSLQKQINKLDSKNVRQQLIKKGYAQTKKYSWKKTAKTTEAAYEKVLSQN